MSEIKVNSIKGVAASTAALTINNTDGTCTANITNNLSNRNLIINGAMQVAQRGTSTTTNGYLIDRFRSNLGGLDQLAFTMSQSTDAPTGFRKSLKFDVTTAETGGIGSDEYAGLRYIAEAQDVAHLLHGTSAAKTMTLSFYVKSAKTGTYCVQIFQADPLKYQLHEYTINQADTWERKTITIQGNTSDAINNDNGIGLRIAWHLVVGSGDHASATSSWVSGSSFKATSNQVNLWDNSNNDWFLTGCQLEIGTVATDFEHRSFGQELTLCQRYYISYGRAAMVYYNMGNIDGGNEAQTFTIFPTEMRTAPSSLDTSGTASDYFLRVNSNVTCTSVPTLSGGNKTTKDCEVIFRASGHGFTSGHACFGRAANTANSFLGFSSEL